jgi:hypothetical protein
MYKKMSLLLLLICSGCNQSSIEPLVQQSIPELTSLQQATQVEIANDWNGYSDITPVLRHSKLRLESKQLVGNAYIAIGGYGAAGIHQQTTKKVKIPVATTTKFLATLAKTPLQTGAYQPKIQWVDDYPSIKIQIKTNDQQVIFSSRSQGRDHIPWQITIIQANKTTEYISNSAFPAQALHVLAPYIDRPGIEPIIERRRQQSKPQQKLPRQKPPEKSKPQQKSPKKVVK